MGQDKDKGKGKGGHEARFFFYNDVKYEVEADSLTGHQIKAMIEGFEPNYALMLEGHGNDPDHEITDNTRVAFDTPYPLRFYAVPPAQFGTA